MEQVFREDLAGPRIVTGTLSVFSAIALALALLGVYGVVSYGVTRQTREIGIRTALGARPIDVARQVLSSGTRLAAAGVAIGIAGALTLARLMTAALYQTSAADIPTLLTITAAILAMSLLAALAPALRAARIDPQTALRYE
jgi:putative ABC transport system permease protein